MKFFNHKFLTILLLAAALTGCASERQAKVETQHNLNNPQFVGNLKLENGSGGKLYRIDIKYPSDTHCVYYFDSNPTLTVNHLFSRGKSRVNKVEIFINGVLDKTSFITNNFEIEKQ